MAASISASVGSYESGAVNRSNDVRTIQDLLTKASQQLSCSDYHPGVPDGKIHRTGSKSATVRAIGAFQTGEVGMSRADFRVDVGGGTFNKMLAVTGKSVPTPPVAAAKSSDFAKSIVSIALAEVGNMESGGNNVGDDIFKYKAASWLDPNSAWPWCAAFVGWCYREAMQQTNASGISRPQTALAYDYERWAREQSKVDLYKPPGRILAGDLVTFNFSHIGIAVADEASGIVKTVEGNTNTAGTRDGGGRVIDGVFRKSRVKSSIRAAIRTSYNSEVMADQICDQFTTCPTE